MAQSAKMSFLQHPNSRKWLTFLSSTLQTMRENDVMCDVMVRASDGQMFPAHACILAACSPILKSSLILKSSSQYEVKLDGISGDMWQKLIHYIYTGKLDVPMTHDFLHAAKQLKIRSFDNFLNSHSQDGSSKDGMFAAEQEIQTFQASSKECDRVTGDRSDDEDDVNAGDDISDSDTDDYSVGNAGDIRGSYDEMKLESSSILPAIRQSPCSNNVKLENTSPNIVNGVTSAIRKSDSAILQRNTTQKRPTTTSKGQFLCDKCPKSYRYKASFLKHQKRHTEKPGAAEQTSTVNTEKRRYECGDCNKLFRSRFVLRRHQILHSANNPHVCSICGRQFTQNSDVRQHMRTHTGEKPCVCSFCGKTFTSVSSLNVHNRTHNPEKPHKCTVCGRCFTCRMYLQRHMVVHGALKAYRCTECGKSFRDSGVLNVHRRVHTRERPLKCDVCGKSFRESSALLSHKRRHTGEKPFECKICGKTFTTTSHLYTHARTHLSISEKIHKVSRI